LIDTLRWLYRIPGSLLVEAMGNAPVLSDMLGIQASAARGYASLQGGLVNILSLMFWAMLILWVLYSSSTPKAEPESDSPRRMPRLRMPSHTGHGLPLHANHDRHHPRQQQIHRHSS
ncbi:MAG TPA: hypothetical protein PK461_03710, partial [Alcaligenes faecalis]|nr:hypothetical protein [Alcaligenes faecalis]